MDFFEDDNEDYVEGENLDNLNFELIEKLGNLYQDVLEIEDENERVLAAKLLIEEAGL
jgi:hypothetical protein